MPQRMDRRTFMGVVGAGALATWPSWPCRAEGAEAKFAGLAQLGEKFRFAICADPQVGPKDSKGRVAANARRTQILAVEEINALDPQPAFVVFLGDLCNTFNPPSVANFEECISGLEPQPVLVHGNHDTQPPFEAFRALQERTCGFDDVFFSWNAGRWHFLTVPSNLQGHDGPQKEAEMATLAWLESDLEAHRDRPTMAFVHFHAMPQGLTQLEWYNYPLPLRQRLMELFTRHGNVRWYFNGHVHNGLKASVKTSWNYRGIDFVTCPTIIQSRNFGEEFAGYEAGLDSGGYYLLVDVDGDAVTLTGRLAGVAEPFVYPKAFRRFTDDIEPRWFRRVSELPGTPELVNGGFADGLAGWQSCYRYVSDTNPGFECSCVDAPGRPGVRAARLLTRVKEPVSWASDENTELYQVVSVGPEESPALTAAYYLDEDPQSGGGYVRLVALQGDAYRFLMMFKWGEQERQSHIMPRAFGYALHGEQQSWRFLQQLGERKQGLFWDVPAEAGHWHRLEANVAALYDEALGEPGAYARLGIDKAIVAVGTWCNRDAGSVSAACFTDLDLAPASADTPSRADGTALECGPSVFRTEFGQELEDRVSSRPANRS